VRRPCVDCVCANVPDNAPKPAATLEGRILLEDPFEGRLCQSACLMRCTEYVPSAPAAWVAGFVRNVLLGSVAAGAMGSYPKPCLALCTAGLCVWLQALWAHVQGCTLFCARLARAHGCRRYGLMFKSVPRALFITLEDRGRVFRILKNWPERNVQVVCCMHACAACACVLMRVTTRMSRMRACMPASDA